MGKIIQLSDYIASEREALVKEEEGKFLAAAIIRSRPQLKKLMTYFLKEDNSFGRMHWS